MALSYETVSNTDIIASGLRCQFLKVLIQKKTKKGRNNCLHM